MDFKLTTLFRTLALCAALAQGGCAAASAVGSVASLGAVAVATTGSVALTGAGLAVKGVTAVVP